MHEGTFQSLERMNGMKEAILHDSVILRNRRSQIVAQKLLKTVFPQPELDH
jgi:hypothetical protein